MYESDTSPAAMVGEWKRKPVGDQMYTNTKTLFEAEQKALSEVHWLTGDTSRVHGYDYESVMTALKKGLDTILVKFNNHVE